MRIDEALGAQVAGYTYQEGHPVLRIKRMGGKIANIPLNLVTVRALDAYLDATPHW